MTTTPEPADIVLANSMRPIGYQLYDAMDSVWEGISGLMDFFYKSDIPQIPKFDSLTSVISTYEDYSNKDLQSIKEAFTFNGRITSLVEKGPVRFFSLSDKTGSVTFIADELNWRKSGLSVNTQANVTGSLRRFCGRDGEETLGFILIPTSAH
jgi:lysyl-tRNA synthetase class II